MKAEIKITMTLAVRIEDDKWNAYLVGPDGDQTWLASIRLGLVGNNPERKADFVNLMKSVVSDHIEKETGDRPEWPDETTPKEGAE